MNKNQKKIYTIILIVLNLALIASIIRFIFFRQNKESLVSNTSTEITIESPLVTEISWEETQTLLNSCQVTFIFQQKNLDVSITTKDQKFYKTKQPKLNDIIYKINHLPSICTETIEKVTE